MPIPPETDVPFSKGPCARSYNALCVAPTRRRPAAPSTARRTPPRQPRRPERQAPRCLTRQRISSRASAGLRSRARSSGSTSRIPGPASRGPKPGWPRSRTARAARVPCVPWRTPSVSPACTSAPSRASSRRRMPSWRSAWRTTRPGHGSATSKRCATWRGTTRASRWRSATWRTSGHGGPRWGWMWPARPSTSAWSTDGAATANRELAATAAMNIGLVLNHLGRYGESLEAGRFAAQEYRELNARERLATVQMNLGLLHVNRGEFGEAIEELSASRALCEELGLEAKRAAVDLDLTRTYQALSLVSEAAEACGHAIDTFRRLDLPFEQATALLLRGQIAERQADTVTARRDLAEARALYARVGNALWETIAALAELRLVAADAPRHTLPGLLDQAASHAARLGDLGALEHAAAGHLLIAEIERQLGRTAAARATLRTA